MSKEHAYAYEAGYRDGSIHYELEHCHACPNVADLQEALAEKAKLREELDEQIRHFNELAKIADKLTVENELMHMEKEESEEYKKLAMRLQAENDKLRELCDLLIWGIENDVPPAEGLVWSQKVTVLMRELGIE